MNVNQPRGNPISHIAHLIHGIAFVCSITIGATFLNTATAQTHTSVETEIPIDYHKKISSSLEKSILNTKTFPIYINYPGEILTKGFLLRKTIDFDAQKQSLVFTDNKGGKKFLYLTLKEPFEFGLFTVVSLTLKNLSYNSEADKFSLDVTAETKIGLQLNETVSLLKSRILDATSFVAIPENRPTWTGRTLFAGAIKEPSETREIQLPVSKTDETKTATILVVPRL